MNDLYYISKEVGRLAAEIKAPEKYFPGFGNEKYDSVPYVEIHGPTYRYLRKERGQERIHDITFDFDELLYWIFRDITGSMAYEYYRLNPTKEKDSRRMAFEQQLRLLEEINPIWKQRREQEIAEILQKAPYTSGNL
jgi:hypothetical protein